MPGRVLYFGISHSAHFQAQDLQQTPGGGFLFTLSANPFQGVPPGSLRGAKCAVIECGEEGRAEVRFHLPLLGRHNVLNVLASLAVCYLFGIPPLSLTEAVAALRPASMRGETIRLANGALVVNDCYNSSPEALEAMLVAVASLPARRRFAVLGGMMELGPASEALHYRGGHRVGELRFDALFTVGEQARPFEKGAHAAGLRGEALAHFDFPEEAAARLRDILQEGDVVLLKASRAVHMEKVWEQLRPLAISDTAGRAK